MKIRRLLPSSTLVFSIACGGPSQPAEEPITSASAAPSAASAATTSLATSAAPSASASSTPVAPESKTASADVDGADGVRRMASWDGPKTGTAVKTKRAWVIGPNLMGDKGQLSFGSVYLRVVTVDQSDDKELVFTESGKKYGVPAALAWPAEPAKGLKKGDFARCEFGGNSVVARVEAVDAKKVTCTFRFMAKTKKADVEPDGVLALHGKIETGAPALVKFDDGDTRFNGFVLAAGNGQAWVHVDTQFADGDPKAHHAFHLVKNENVEVLDLKPLKVGDDCLADDIAHVEPCKVSKVIEGGLAYLVTFDGRKGHSDEWELDGVAKGPKVEKPKKK